MADEIVQRITTLGQQRVKLKADLKANEDALKHWVREGARAHLSERMMATIAKVTQSSVSKWVSGTIYLEQTSRHRVKTGYCSYPDGPCLREARRT